MELKWSGAEAEKHNREEQSKGGKENTLRGDECTYANVLKGRVREGQG